MEQLKQNIKNLPQNYDLIIPDKDNKEIKINKEEEYKRIEDILFIREIKEEILEQYEFAQDFYEEKFSCTLCFQIIEDENPYLCQKCQKIFHEKCLKAWFDKLKEKKMQTSCPNCRNELTLEQWNRKIEFKRDKENYYNIMRKIKEEKIKNNMNNNIIILKDKKIKEMKDDNNKQAELIKKYENYMDKTFQAFKNIISKINSIHYSLKSENNNKLIDLINNYPLNLENLDLDNISNIINEELDFFKNNQINNFQFNPMKLPPNLFNFPSPQILQMPKPLPFPMFMSGISTGVIWNITFTKKEDVQISNDDTLSKAYNLFQVKTLDMNTPLKFTFNNNILDPNEKLYQSGLDDNSVIQVEPVSKDKIILLFEVQDVVKKATVAIEISPDRNFLYAFELFKIKTKIEEKVFFIYNAKVLNEGLTIKEAGLKNYSKIIAVIERIIG